MQNEGEIEELLQRNGFEIVYPETLSLADQVRTFAEAQCVIGPSGSGMFNTAFAPDACRVVDIETFHVTVAQHALFYSSCGHPYAFLFATPEPDPRASRRKVDTVFRQKAMLNQRSRATCLIPESGMSL